MPTLPTPNTPSTDDDVSDSDLLDDVGEGPDAEEEDFDAEKAQAALSEKQSQLKELQSEIEEQQKVIAENITAVPNASLADCVNQFQAAAKKDIKAKAKAGTLGGRRRK